MKYTPQQLCDIAPFLAQAVTRAPAQFRERGTRLMSAIETVTRCADLLQPIVGDQIGEIAASYLLPQVHSYLKEVSGRPATPALFQLAPAALLSAEHTRLFESMGKLFSGGFDI